jgi:putative tricarboxylic transport membrane protein
VAHLARLACAIVLLVSMSASAAAQATAGSSAIDQLRLIAPAAPGGGWDQTARAMQQVLQRTGLARTVLVENIAGAAGTIGLARFVGSEQGRGDALMVSGLIMLGGVVMHGSPVTLRDVTPIARITGEYEAIVVPASSPLRTLGDLIQALRDRPEAISWGGGSAGGSDQILAGLVAKAVGVAPHRINYVAFSGGGESLSAILGAQVSVGVNGLAELAPQIAAGTVRALAVSSAERLPGLDVPTLREQGVDVQFENWRSVVAPPAISAADRRRLESAVASMVRTPEWRAVLERYRWIDRYLAGDDFIRFDASEEARVRAILVELGTAQGGSTRASKVYPWFVLGGLAICGLILAAARTPRDRGSPGVPTRLVRTRDAWWVVLGLALTLAMMEYAGFVVTAAVLFWFTARAFDRRHPVGDAVAAIGVSTGAYLLFARVLQLPLP